MASSVLAHFVLKERLNKLGVLGCISCIVGSVVVVLHAPEEHMPDSVEEIWDLATQPGESSACTHTSYVSCSAATCLTAFLHIMVSTMGRISSICGNNIVTHGNSNSVHRTSVWSEEHTDISGYLLFNGIINCKCAIILRCTA